MLAITVRFRQLYHISLEYNIGMEWSPIGSAVSS